jgi:imidazolonepropionase-like amidohydrolase
MRAETEYLGTARDADRRRRSSDGNAVVQDNYGGVSQRRSAVSDIDGCDDATGKFLIPGLADMHLHLTGAGEPTGSREFFLPLLVANGITTVRDMGGKVEYLKKLRSEIDSGQRLGPQIFFTGPYLAPQSRADNQADRHRSARDAYQAVTELKQQDVDFIKVQSRLSREAYFAIAKESQTQQIRFVGHVPDTVSALEAAEAGQASVEHLTGVLLATSSREEELRRRQLAPGPANESPDAAFERSRQWQAICCNPFRHKNRPSC